MNWGSGFFRIYVIAWVVWAIVAGVPAYIETQRIRDEVEQLEHRIQRAVLERIEVNRLERIVLAVPGEELDESLVRKEEEDRVRESARPRARHPARYTVRAWALWVLVGIVAPGVLLGAGCWVWAGFRSRRERG